MTPHHHWLRNYVPKCVPIKLADNKTVYSAGEGTVVFKRLAHHHYEGVKKLLKKKLVTGMTLDSSVAPHPIYEPCLAGKMHANPFPPSEWSIQITLGDDSQCTVLLCI